MNKAECLQFFGVDDIMNLPKAVERVIQLPTDERDRIYREFMRMNNYEMGRDWFQRVYDAEVHSLLERCETLQFELKYGKAKR